MIAHRAVESLLGILAQRDRWERLGDRFTGESSRLGAADIWGVLLFAAGFVVLLWWLERLSRRFEGCISKPHPGRLFADLCRAHRLSRRDRSLLKRLAASTDQPHAAYLFVRPELFTPDALPDEAEAVAHLAELLFARRDVKEKESDSPRGAGEQTTDEPPVARDPSEQNQRDPLPAAP